MDEVIDIKWKRCKKCGFIQHQAHLRCLNCKNESFEDIKTKGTCKLISYTILHAPPKEFRDRKSYPLGIVEFNNGVRALGQLTEEKNLKIGMELKPIYKKICNNLDGNEVYAYVFEPIK
jgi:hypothetical protein